MSVLAQMRKLNNSSKGFTLIEVVVALSVLSLGVAGVANLRNLAYRHITLTEEIQQASYLADSHLVRLSSKSNVGLGFQAGQYTRGAELPPYPWELNLIALDESVLQPQSNSLSSKVRPLRADLSVWVDSGKRQLRFHALLLAPPAEVKSDALNLK